MIEVRKPAVAGTFYPDDAAELKAAVCGYLEGAAALGQDVPKALIAPHAGYIYSGPVAASAYAQLRPLKGKISRVVLIGPSHRVGFRGLALCTASAYAIPGKTIALDLETEARLASLPGVGMLDSAHASEHSLEVHLPFLVEALGDFRLVPIVAGQADRTIVADVLEAAWGGLETLIVVSTDLSHFHDYDEARGIDRKTVDAIEQLNADFMDGNHACGAVPVAGLLELAKRKSLAVKTLDVRNSGDTAGPHDRVVGYGAWAFYEGGAHA
ncbi:MAG: AmmeMemoRadiSam system protein B [Alphaproteobacteria bacterium]|nr:AmmeMemoRadiSam system protein B [Alphaproteobacteria bacterium]